jgi:hypothetical protein
VRVVQPDRQSVLISEPLPAGERTYMGAKAMDVVKILAELRQEREQIEEAILSLERLAQGRGRRRGRPPSWMVEARKRERISTKKARPETTARAAVA